MVLEGPLIAGLQLHGGAEREEDAAAAEFREQSPIRRELIDSGSMSVVSGLYHLDTGNVEFEKPTSNVRR